MRWMRNPILVTWYESQCHSTCSILIHIPIPRTLFGFLSRRGQQTTIFVQLIKCHLFFWPATSGNSLTCVPNPCAVRHPRPRLRISKYIVVISDSHSLFIAYSLTPSHSLFFLFMLSSERTAKLCWKTVIDQKCAPCNHQFTRIAK